MKYRAIKTLTAVSALLLGFPVTLFPVIVQAADNDPYVQYVDPGSSPTVRYTQYAQQTDYASHRDIHNFGELSDAILAATPRNQTPPGAVPSEMHAEYPEFHYERGENIQDVLIRRMTVTLNDEGGAQGSAIYAVNLPPNIADYMEREVLRTSTSSSAQPISYSMPTDLRRVDIIEELVPVASNGAPLVAQTPPTQSAPTEPAPSGDAVLLLDDRPADPDLNDITIGPSSGNDVSPVVALRPEEGTYTGSPPPTRSYAMAIDRDYPVVLVATIPVYVTPLGANEPLPKALGEDVRDQIDTGIPAQPSPADAAMDEDEVTSPSTLAPIGGLGGAGAGGAGDDNGGHGEHHGHHGHGHHDHGHRDHGHHDAGAGGAGDDNGGHGEHHGHHDHGHRDGGVGNSTGDTERTGRNAATDGTSGDRGKGHGEHHEHHDHGHRDGGVGNGTSDTERTGDSTGAGGTSASINAQ